MSIDETPLVTVVTVTFNNASTIRPFLDSLERHAPDWVEVVIVDNASSDGSVDLIRGHRAVTRLIESERNVGFGRASNQGARTARGRFLFFLNPDVTITAGSIEALVDGLAERPTLGVLSATTCYPDEQPEPRPEIELQAAVPGSALMVARSRFEEAGGFDESMFLYWEDTEFCWRSWIQGWEVGAHLGAVVFHDRGVSSGGRRWDAELTKNSVYTYLKTMRWRVTVVFIVTALGKSAAKVVLGRGRGQAGAWIWNFRRLPKTLRARAELLGNRRVDPAHLERMVRAHRARMRTERRQRKRH